MKLWSLFPKKFWFAQAVRNRFVFRSNLESDAAQEEGMASTENNENSADPAEAGPSLHEDGFEELGNKDIEVTKDATGVHVEDVLDQIEDEKDIEKPTTASNENSDRAVFDSAKSKTDETIETNRQKVEEFLEKLPNQDLAQAISRAHAINTDLYKSERGVLNNLKFYGREPSRRAVEMMGDFYRGFSEFGRRFALVGKIEDEDDQLRERKNIVAEFQSYTAEWEDIKAELQLVITELKMIFRQFLPEVDSNQIVAVYFDNADKALEAFDAYFSELTQTSLLYADQLSGDEIFWSKLPERMQDIQKYVSFEDGTLAEKTKESDAGFEAQTNAVFYLKQKKFFRENSAEFTEELFQVKENFAKNARSYAQNFKNLRAKIKKDLRGLGEKEFFSKYGQEPDVMRILLDQHQSQVFAFDETLKSLDPEKFSAEFFQNFSESDGARADALSDLARWEQYEKVSADAAKFSAEFSEMLDELTPHVSVNVYYVSLDDIYRVFTEYFESIERLRKRKSDRAMYQLGADTFGPDSKVGKDFRRKSESAEADRVGEYDAEKESKNGWDIQDDLYNTGDPDEAKSCIGLLIKNGFMKWDDPYFWLTLERLGGGVHFDINYKNPMDSPGLRYTPKKILNNVRRACENIWSTEDFNVWDKSLKSSAQSAQDGFNGEFESYETTDANARTEILAGMLSRFAKGEREGVDPARFEGFLRRAFTDGKMNGGSKFDQRWYFLVHGVAMGLLSRDALARINGEFLGSSPLADFFSDKTWHKNGRLVPANTPGATNEQTWGYNDYLAWAELLGDDNGNYFPRNTEEAHLRLKRFHYDYVTKSPYARDRFERMVRIAPKNIDHDDAGLYSGILSVSDVTTLIARESGGPEKLTPDWWRNLLTHYDEYFRNVVRQTEEGNIEYGTDNVDWIKSRDDELMHAGRCLKTAISVLQTLQGNVDLFGSKRNTVFDKARWEASSDYSLSANNSRDEINKVTRIFLKNADISEEDRKNYLAVLEHDSIAQNMEYGKQVLKNGAPTDKIVKDMVRGSIGDQIFASSPDDILRNLREYIQMG